MTSERNGQAGFTLLELLVVIAIMGVLSGVAVFALGALRDTAQSTTCDADAKVLDTAQEAAFTLGGSFLDEQALVDGGYINEPSTLHDVTVLGSTYELIPVGDCATDGAELAEGAEPTEGADESAAKEVAAKEAAEKAAAAEKEAAEKVPADTAEAEKEAAAKAAAQKEAAEKEAAQKAAAEKEAAEKAAAEKEAGCRRGQVDVNSADKKELREIDHVGGDEATRIVKQRPFKGLEQLTEVKGLSEQDVKDIIEQGVACIG